MGVLKNYLNLPARKPRTKRDQIEYLKNHYGYGVGSGFVPSEIRFAHNVKITHLPLDYETEQACFRLLDNPFCYPMVVEPVLNVFEKLHPGWHIYSEGRSSGYLTLSGYYRPSRSEDYSGWSGAEVKGLFEVVWDFDQVCQEAVAAFVDYATYAETEEA